MVLIYVKNKSRNLSADHLNIMIRACEIQLPQFCKDWNIELCNLKLIDNNIEPSDNPLRIIEMVDTNPLDNDSIAYHNQKGKLIYSKVFVDYILRQGGCRFNIGERQNNISIEKVYSLDEHMKMDNPLSVSGALYHELLEMLINPYVNEFSSDFKKTLWCKEVCDPIQEYVIWVSAKYKDKFYDVSLSDYIYPEYFDWDEPPFGKGGKPRDYRQMLKTSFSVSSGGYMIIMKSGREIIKNGMTVNPKSYDPKYHIRLAKIKGCF